VKPLALLRWKAEHVADFRSGDGSCEPWFHSFCAAAVVLLTRGLTAHPGPVRIAHIVWVGFGPLFIAQKKGFFAREGVEVELIRIEEHTTTYAGLYSGQIDAVAAAFQDAPAFSDPDEAL
jgi:ABC-type nitrate/sulfonate/bicarbonate transport system substrate-binding protein